MTKFVSFTKNINLFCFCFSSAPASPQPLPFIEYLPCSLSPFSLFLSLSLIHSSPFPLPLPLTVIYFLPIPLPSSPLDPTLRKPFINVFHSGPSLDALAWLILISSSLSSYYSPSSFTFIFALCIYALTSSN